MASALKRSIAFLLVLVLAIGMIPTAFAAEVEPTDSTTSDTHATDPPEETTSEDTLPVSQPESETISLPEDEMDFLALDNGIAAFVEAEISGAPNAFANLTLPNGGIDIPAQGYIQHKKILPLYSVYLKNQTGYANNYYVAYCIEPGVELGNTGHSGTAYTLDGMTEGSGAMYRLSREKVEAIGVALMYGQRDIASKKDEQSLRYEKLCRHAATQAIIWEIACGWRSPYPPYTLWDSTLYDASVSFTNKLNTGSVKLVKVTNTGENLSGWQIGLYTDAGCTNTVSGSPFTTGADGTVTVTGLISGTYYAKELSTDDPYWEVDSAVKSLKVDVGQTAEVTFTNTHYGRIEFRKTTNTGNQLGGWTFRVKDSNGNTIGDFTTDANGYACTENLPLGRYTVVELPTEDNYWLTELGFHDVTVKAGETTVDTWLNKDQGLVWFYKKTNTGESVEGWHITVYADETCTQKVGTLITNEDGRAGYYLDPGTYWAKETGDEHGRFEDEYWMVDETVHKFEIKPHEDVSITFTNVQYGRLKITKTVEGWQFKITDAEGTVLDGSPFSTDEDGIILTRNLLPGTYAVEELLPENSLYQCVSENPQTVTVKQGEIAEVSFTNAMRSGKITIEKIDTAGEPLAGATFLLEWSAEGSLWYPVQYSKELTKGGCSNSALVDGTLTSGEDGLLEWDNLYPGLHYRVTELKAPNGYELLKGYAFEGELPADDLQVSLQVVNAKGFSLPDTGASTGLILRILQLACTAVCATLLLIAYKKKRW